MLNHIHSLRRFDRGLLSLLVLFALASKTFTCALAFARRKPHHILLPSTLSSDEIHAKLMKFALEEAREAGKMGEVPIGAVITRELPSSDGSRKFEIVSRGRNLVETRSDASAHAELQAMRKAALSMKNWRLLNTTLYSTLEPCPMCLAAAQAFRCKSVVYGAPDLRLGAVKTHIKLLEMAKHPYHDIEASGNVLEEESATMMKDFFRERRKQNRKGQKLLGGEEKSMIRRILQTLNPLGRSSQ